MDLILVESPTKSKTIARFLGDGFKVEATMGHIRDLPAGKFGVDIKKDFEPEYAIPDKAKKTVAALKKLAKTADQVILATDEDREGESISWHLAQILKLKNPKRIVFHEITKDAIEQALKNPREIDMNLVNAQQARRVLDRIVGYKLSPFLWKKVAQGLSAGRVQSVAVRLVAEREKEIKAFEPQEYWEVEALFKKDGQEFGALLAKKAGKAIGKLGIPTKEDADRILKDLEKSGYVVKNIEEKETKKLPPPPFTTSTLQQEAWQRFHFSAKLTMSLAQHLYENGLSTYHRTDSLNLAELALDSSKKYILDNFGPDYFPGFSRKYRTKSKSAQEAHEAIRPTFVENSPESLGGKLDERQLKLYDLIWRRFVASQMTEAKLNSIQATISAKEYEFSARGQTLKFDGFLKIYPLKFEDTTLPKLQPGEQLDLLSLSGSQHSTQPPGRYSEATLVKALEKSSIGRPSTYAPILETIQLRGYAQKDEKKLFFPTEIGNLVNDLLVQHFPQVVDINFTARMEESLDEISQGKRKWVPVIAEFYLPFSQNLKAKEKEVLKKDVLSKLNEEQISEVCPLCQSPLLAKISRFGKFYACAKFPECKYKKNVLVSLKLACPKCQQGEIVERFTRSHKRFYGCSRWPDCDFASWDKPTGEHCESCSSLIVKNRWGREKCINPECLSNKDLASRKP